MSELGWPSIEALLDAGAGAVVVTLGAAGVDLHRAGSSSVHVDAIPVDVIDTTGAGDAFCGALAAWLAEGAAIEDSIAAAVAAGALATRAVGARASLPTRAELDEALDRRSGRAP